MSLPPIEVPTGAMRFNSDSQKLEYYDGAQWLQVSTFSPLLNGGARGVFVGGRSGGSARSVMDYINISSTGNSINFATLSQPKRNPMCFGSSVRGVAAGGLGNPAYSTNIEVFTFASTGTSSDSGFDIAAPAFNGAGLSNSTRGIIAGGDAGGTTVTNLIQYVTIAALGNAVDFGYLSTAKQSFGSCASSTRGIFASGAPSTNVIEFITISTIGNVTDFGDLTTNRNSNAGCSNATRGLFGGGGPSASNIIDYITIATLGNAVNFGNLTQPRVPSTAAVSSSTRAIWGGGEVPGGVGVNVIDYVTTMSTGNAVDFGDLVNGVNYEGSACSNGHGGL